jgi:hypothetical protein
VVEKSDQTRRRISLELSEELLTWLDGFKAEWGLRSRGDILERLLEQLVPGQPDEDGGEPEPEPADSLNETGAIVLINRDLVSQKDLDLGTYETDGKQVGPLDGARGHSTQGKRPGGGIDLPGFVRRQTGQLKRSLELPGPGTNQTLQGWN